MAKNPRSNRKPKAGDGFGPSESGEPIQPTKAERNAANAEARRQKRMFNQYMNDLTSSGKVKAKYAKNVKSPGRAQPKGTPPRTGPGSGAGGQSARYSRLTGGGLMKHGR